MTVRGINLSAFLAVTVVAVLGMLYSTPARAELKPEEIAIVAAKGNRESEQLAAYYMKARAIPADQLCLVDVPKQEECPRDQWTWAIRPEIHKWLEEHDPQRKLRCLVTVWGIPLKVGPAAVDPARVKYQQFLEGERRQRLDLLKAIGQQLDALAENVAVAEPDAKQVDPNAPKSELHVAQAEVEKHLQAAQARVAKLEGDDLKLAAAKLQQLATLAGGARVVLQGMERQLAIQPNAPEMRSQYDLLRGRAAGFAEMQVLLDQVPLGYYHDALVMAALERNGGLLGTVEWLDNQLDIVKKNETGASLDSELSLVLWPDDYELLRWQPNYLRIGYESSQWPKVFPTLMVARIDASTLRLAKGLIDAAIDTEAKGLQGKAYFDARGMGKLEGPNPQPGSYEDYDRAVLITAKGMKEQTTIDVTLNTRPELFKADECPDAALYCGWYSLAKYVDAFTWKPGAVAYHLASGEASTLRDPASEAWCKKMIEDGVAATIGPVYEPYLMAFPRPEQFFGVLLKGDLTLVEAYYRTLPFNSWMMTLIGDPLYRPFKNMDVTKKGAGAGGGGWPRLARRFLGLGQAALVAAGERRRFRRRRGRGSSSPLSWGRSATRALCRKTVFLATKKPPF